jgi:hypothetical protein
MKGYSDRSFIEERTGIVRRIYSYDGKPARRFELSGKVVDQLRGYVLIEKDLRNVAEWLKQLGIDPTGNEAGVGRTSKLIWRRNPDRTEGVRDKGLFVAALTFYAKGFTKCEGRPVKMEKQQLETRFHALHDECMRYRHNFAAHSGAGRIEDARIALVIPKKAKRPVVPMLYVELDQPDVVPPYVDGLSMADLCAHANAVVKRKMSLLMEKVKEEVASKGWEYWDQKK